MSRIRESHILITGLAGNTRRLEQQRELHHTRVDGWQLVVAQRTEVAQSGGNQLSCSVYLGVKRWVRVVGVGQEGAGIE